MGSSCEPEYSVSGAFGSAGHSAKSAKYILPKRGGGFSSAAIYDLARVDPRAHLLTTLREP